MLFSGGFTFANLLADAFAIFLFLLWFWLLITVAGDPFRRHDVSGFGKAPLGHPAYRARRGRRNLCLPPHPGRRHDPT